MATTKHVVGEDGVAETVVMDDAEAAAFAASIANTATIDDVARERTRRLAAGFVFNFGDVRGSHHIGSTPPDMAGWDEVTKWSQACCLLGEPDQSITILTDTGPATITAMEWQSILLAATAFRQPIWAASFALQAMDPIPFDYAADHRWP